MAAIKILGSRLRKAREDLGLNQGAFAKLLGLSSEYISLLEAGKRSPSLQTLRRLAAFLKKDVRYFFEERKTGFEGLLAGPGLEDRTRREILRFRAACERYLELEEAAGRRLDLAPAYGPAAPDRLAEEERRRIGLGNEPIRDVFGLCEMNGCRVLRHPFSEEAKIAGVFVYDEERRAAFAGINANEPPGLQIVIAAHEYAHYLRDRFDGPVIDNSDVVQDEYVSLYSPREQFAQAFAGFFLVPPSKLRDLVEKDRRPRSLGFDDVLFFKRYFGVSSRTMLRCLRGQGYLPDAKFEEYFKRNPEDREAEVFGSASGTEERRSRALFRKARARAVPSDRFRLLASEAGPPGRSKGEAAAKTGGTGGARESKS